MKRAFHEFPSINRCEYKSQLHNSWKETIVHRVLINNIRVDFVISASNSKQQPCDKRDETMRRCVPTVEFINVWNSVVLEKTTLLFLYAHIRWRVPFLPEKSLPSLCRAERRVSRGLHRPPAYPLRPHSESTTTITFTAITAIPSLFVSCTFIWWRSAGTIHHTSLSTKGRLLFQSVRRFLLAPLPNFIHHRFDSIAHANLVEYSTRYCAL